MRDKMIEALLVCGGGNQPASRTIRLALAREGWVMLNPASSRDFVWKITALGHEILASLPCENNVA